VLLSPSTHRFAHLLATAFFQRAGLRFAQMAIAPRRRTRLDSRKLGTGNTSSNGGFSIGLVFFGGNRLTLPFLQHPPTMIQAYLFMKT